jgi:hypothetical protein
MVDTNDELQGLEMPNDAQGHLDGENWYLDGRMKRLLLDLQRHWLLDYQASREKALVEITERVRLNIPFEFYNIFIMFLASPRISGRSTAC